MARGLSLKEMGGWQLLLERYLVCWSWAQVGWVLAEVEAVRAGCEGDEV